MAVRTSASITLLAVLSFIGVLNMVMASISQSNGVLFLINPQFTDKIAINDNSEILKEKLGRGACAMQCSGMRNCASFFWGLPNNCQLHSETLNDTKLKSKLQQTHHTEYFISNNSRGK